MGFFFRVGGAHAPQQSGVFLHVFGKCRVCFPVQFRALKISQISIAARRDAVLLLQGALFVGVFNVAAETTILIVVVAALLNGARRGELLEFRNQLSVGRIQTNRFFATSEGLVPSVHG